MGKGKGFDSDVELLFDWFLQSYSLNEETEILSEILELEIKYKRKTERKQLLIEWTQKNKELPQIENISLLLKEILRI